MYCAFFLRAEFEDVLLRNALEEVGREYSSHTYYSTLPDCIRYKKGKKSTGAIS